MNTDLKPGDKIAFDVEGKSSYVGYGTVTRVSPYLMIQPDRPIPSGFRIKQGSIRKVEGSNGSQR